jgi:exonuclease III
MLLVSWNAAGRRSGVEEQATRVVELGPDIVCLQELTRVTARPWAERLAEAGLAPRWRRCPPRVTGAGGWRC